MWLFSKNINHPDFIRQYLNQDFRQSKTYVVFDCETTGLDTKTDDILSISAVKLNENLQIDVRSFIRFYLHSDKINQGKNADIHEIVSQDLEQAISAEKFLPFFLNYIETSTLVGHFIEFDIAMINRYLKQYYHVKLKNRTICTLRLSIEKEGYSNRLDEVKSTHFQLFEVCKRLDVPANHQHTSEGDVLANAMLFQKLISLR